MFAPGLIERGRADSRADCDSESRSCRAFKPEIYEHLCGGIPPVRIQGQGRVFVVHLLVSIGLGIQLWQGTCLPNLTFMT